jgi:hypothetical protein
MFLSYLTLAVALSLSMVAAWYSILGLTAIFAAAVIPIVIMGGILEVGKVVITVWLHEYWKQCRWLMKAYLVPAVAVLMLITSMGIFGFLSKAHTDQGMVSGDVQAKIAIYDEKIRTERENIDANRKALKQLDEAVDQIMGRSTSEEGAARSVQIRRSQQAERGRLLKEIAESQKRITALNEERAPIAAEVRKVEAEVGPIKYIAALVYGDNPDANLLEAAVRWVIILLVVVFDPLAIMMLLAATESMKWERERRQLIESELNHQSDQTSKPVDEFQAELDKKRTVAQALDSGGDLPPEDVTTVESPLPHHPDTHPYLNQGFQYPPGWMFQPPLVAKQPQPLSTGPIFLNWPPEQVSAKSSDPDQEEIAEDTPELKAAKARWKAENPGQTLKHERYRLAKGEIDELPWMQYMRAAPHFGFGLNFPDTSAKGDTWMKTDQVPHQLYKFNGSNWIMVDKRISDQYTTDTAYTDYLIAQIAAGQYDPDMLTDSEQTQVESHLQNKDKQ